MNRRILVFDTTLRDGEQSPGAAMTVEQKLRLAETLERIGVDRIEAGFPVSSPVQFSAVRQIAERLQQATVVGLSRCVRGDIDAVSRALAHARRPMLHLFIATSPLHRECKLHLSRAQVLEAVTAHLEYARRDFSEIEFSAEDASRTESDFLAEVVRTAIAAGATTINIPDTVGYAEPEEFGARIAALRRAVPELERVTLSVHCHNDLGLAVANSLAAIGNGAQQVEVTLNGIGERAGNCALEELVMALKVRNDRFAVETGIRHELLYPASQLLQSTTGLIIPRNKPIFGDNAFAHESGIHQDGVLKHRETYEIMKPADIGRLAETLVMGRHSGKHSLREKLAQYAIALSDEQFEQAFDRFTRVADRKKEVYDEDIFSIVAELLDDFEQGYRLDYFHTTTGRGNLPSAAVRLGHGGREMTAAATGDGPVDALFKAMSAALELRTDLREYIIQAIGCGQDAQGQVRLTLEIDGVLYSGKGVSTDIIEASGLAFLNAVNRRHLRRQRGAATEESA